MASTPNKPPQATPKLTQSLLSPPSSRTRTLTFIRPITPDIDSDDDNNPAALPTPSPSPQKRRKAQKPKTADQLAKDREKASRAEARKQARLLAAKAKASRAAATKRKTAWKAWLAAHTLDDKKSVLYLSYEEAETQDSWYTTQKCKDLYKLSAAELACLERQERPNPQSSKFAPMKLYRVRDVQFLAFRKAATLAGVDAVDDEGEDLVLQRGRMVFEKENGPLLDLEFNRRREKEERELARGDGGEDPCENNFHRGPWYGHNGKRLY